MRKTHGIEDLPEAVRDELDRITMLEPLAMTDYDKDYLRARSSYLRPEQKEYYKEVLAPTVAKKPESKKK